MSTQHLLPVCLLCARHCASSRVVLVKCHRPCPQGTSPQQAHRPVAGWLDGRAAFLDNPEGGGPSQAQELERWGGSLPCPRNSMGRGSEDRGVASGRTPSNLAFGWDLRFEVGEPWGLEGPAAWPEDPWGGQHLPALPLVVLLVSWFALHVWPLKGSPLWCWSALPGPHPSDHRKEMPHF